MCTFTESFILYGGCVDRCKRAPWQALSSSRLVVSGGKHGRCQSAGPPAAVNQCGEVIWSGRRWPRGRWNRRRNKGNCTYSMTGSISSDKRNINMVQGGLPNLSEAAYYAMMNVPSAIMSCESLINMYFEKGTLCQRSAHTDLRGTCVRVLAWRLKTNVADAARMHSEHE